MNWQVIKRDISRTTTPSWPSQGQNENMNKTYIWLYSNHMALNYT